MKKLYILTLLLSLNFATTFAQCANQVFNLSGTSTVSATQVSVTSVGTVSLNTAYCAATQPYLIGGATSVSGNGSYIFNFNPPVSGITLNFSAISNFAGNSEEVILYVNNAHYSVTTAGISNGCDNLAIISAQGNIAPCASCNGAGWSGMNLIGPISKLEVKDTILTGSPNGSVFSLFICSGVGVNENQISQGHKLFPNPNKGSFKLQIEKEMQSGELVLFNAIGQKVHEQKIAQGENDIITHNLAKGLYTYVVLENKIRVANGKLAVE